MPSRKSSAAGSISAKFKALRVALKKWHVNLSKIKALIADCNTVILYFDGLEELCSLTQPELNFRRIVKLHLEEILHLQFIYWKQRCTILFIKIGEENSKFFQAMATERYRKNTISSIKNAAGDVVSNHQQLAGDYCSRVLHSLVQHHIKRASQHH